MITCNSMYIQDIEENPEIYRSDVVTVFYEGPEIFWEKMEIGTWIVGYSSKTNCEMLNNLIKDRAHRIPVDVLAMKIKARCRKIYGQYKKILQGGPQRICEKCGSDKNIHGHHEDYAKPITSLIWLCNSCHRKAHKGRSYQEFFPGLTFHRDGREGKLGISSPILPPPLMKI